MNRSELVLNISALTQIPRHKAKCALDALIDSIIVALANGDTVTIAGFGRFSVVPTKARAGINPRTGQAQLIEASNRTGFKACAKLKQAVNSAGTGPTQERSQ